MKIHFIAIGGSAMHNLAIALSGKDYVVTGSDDEIFEPSKSRLKNQGILPETIGWDENKITEDLDAVVLGMHARNDNPELIKAKKLGIPIYSYPEYIYEQSKNKKRVVIGGSHGKTTITAMTLHALQQLNFAVDYMVGAQLEGYDCMVKLTEENDVIILEGDEYLSSPIDRRPKFHLYRPDIALISGIAWDHINVFPTFENYVSQFEKFCDLIEDGGILVYNAEDENVVNVAQKQEKRLKLLPYTTPKYENSDKGTIVYFDNQYFTLKIFGKHNLQNLMGALNIAVSLGIKPSSFLEAMKDFTGAGKRLEKIIETPNKLVFKDFAHSPSKLKATVNAVKEQYPDRKLIACMELHTFSSLKKEFLPHYKNTMNTADKALVYFSPAVVKHKKLEPVTENDVSTAFGGNIKIATEKQQILNFINIESTENCVILMMSSGNFDGIDFNLL